MPAQGLSFSVPSRTAEYVVTELITHGAVHRVSLGIEALTQPITRRTQRTMEHERPSIVVVSRVVPGSLADEAGIRPGDFVLEVDGHPIGNTDDIHRVLASVDGRDEVTITVYRGTRRRELVGRSFAAARA